MQLRSNGQGLRAQRRGFCGQDLLAQLGGNALHALGMGHVHAEVQLQGADFCGLLVGRRLVVEQVVQGSLAQCALGDFQLGNAQQVDHGHHHADAACDHGAAIFLEARHAQAVHMTDVQQQLVEVAQLGGRNHLSVQALGREGVGHGVGRA
jgi:hypothetical protein